MFKNVSIDIRKLREYCLNSHHPVGKHKARVFYSVLGIDRDDAQILKEKIIAKMENANVELMHKDAFRKRFKADLNIKIRNRNAGVRTIWIVKTNMSVPELVTCNVMI